MPESNVVIDLSHHNQNLDFASMRSSGGILGIIHKATQGLDYADPTYLPHRTSALANDLLWVPIILVPAATASSKPSTSWISCTPTLRPSWFSILKPMVKDPA